MLKILWERDSFLLVIVHHSPEVEINNTVDSRYLEVEGTL